MSKFEDGSYGSLSGISLLAKVLAGRCEMHYTRAAVGKGVIPDGLTPKTMKNCADYVMDAQIAGITNPADGECQVTIQIKSDHVEKGFYATNIILFAEDPDYGEVPYTYLSLENEPEWIRPASSIVGKLATFDLIAAVGDVDHVTATIDPDSIMTASAVQRIIHEHNIDPDAHKNLIRWHCVASRVRDSTRPNYEIGVKGNGVMPVALDVEHYSGSKNISAIVSGTEYDTNNLSGQQDNVSNGTIIVKKVEEIMANIKYVLEQIKLEDTLQDLIAKSDGENVKVSYNGSETTLANALASIAVSLAGLPSEESIDTKISAAIDELIGGAPETYDTLKGIADYIASHKEVSDALDTAITNKVDKVEGKGLSTGDFTAALKKKLDELPVITSANVSAWDAKADKTVASTTANGLMSAADKTRLDALRGVRYGLEAPADMQDGELFIRAVSEA